MLFAASVTGTGSAFPKRRLTNHDLMQTVNTTEEWIIERTGILERRISDPTNPMEFNSTLGFYAAQQALEMANKTPLDIEQIIYATCTPDTWIPSSGCWLQQKLGASNAWAFDLNAACAGFLYAFYLGMSAIQSGQSKNVLVVGADIVSSITNWKDRGSCILFGDGAGAVLIERASLKSQEKSQGGFLSHYLRSDGNQWEILHIPVGGSQQGITPQNYHLNLNKIQMNGKEVFKQAVSFISTACLKVLQASDLTVDDVNWVIVHQANIRILEAVAKRLHIGIEKFLINIDRYGNTSSGTIPTVLDENVRQGKVQKGDLILFSAFGGGITYGSILMRW